jgi:molecular chaperone GrpE
MEKEEIICGENCGCTETTENKCQVNCKCGEKIKDLKLKVEDTTDKYLRSVAELENYKKRVQKEKEDIKNSTKISILSSLLDIDNDLNISIKSIKDKDTRKGIELIMSKLDSYLKSNNIESIQTDIYDSDLHEVISINNNGTKIVDVIGKGYLLNGKPIRYPKVILG